MTSTHQTARSTRRRRPRAVMAALLVALLGSVALLAGCTSNSVVAYLDGSPVLTVEEFGEILPGVEQSLGGQANDEVRSQVISLIVVTRIARNLAEEHDIEVTDDELAVMQQQVGTVEDPAAQAVLDGVAEASVIKQKADQQDPELWTNALNGAEVEVNPRYGAWVAVEGSWTVSSETSLSEPAGQAEQQQGTGG
ncbi:hypothetical protein [Microlunatus sp. Y2014]|uniref:hypothetical protein n=1 Tax=Microlunatus sp. Y2014 TaxID=3418488 RepID=UPI003DA706D5